MSRTSAAAGRTGGPARPTSRSGHRWRLGSGPATASRGRRVLVGVGALVFGLLTGCGGLPTSTEVRRGLPVGSDVLPALRFQFEPPPAGADRETIVRGFLRAASQPEDEGRAAQAYLTQQAFQRWSPGVRATVYDSPDRITVTPLPGDAVRLTVVAGAEVDASGRYRELPTGTLRQTVVRFTRESGEWRVSGLDPGFGRWVQKLYFDVSYRPFRLAYLGVRDRRIILDHRWFPFTPAVATTLARAQLEPPPEYLQGAVTTGVPEGTKLALDTVRVEGSTAVVELSARALDADPNQRRGMWAQMLTTLTQLPRVQSVSLRVDSRRLELLGEQAGPSSLSDLGFSVESLGGTAQVVLRRGTTLDVVDRAEVTAGDDEDRRPRADQPSLPSIPADVSSLAAPADLTELAGITANGQTLRRWQLAGSGGTSQSSPGSALVTPSFDETGLWVGGKDRHGAGRLWFLPRRRSGAVAASPPAQSLDADWLAGRQVRAARMSPHGRRLATVTSGPAGLQIGVSGVQRLPNGTPTQVNPPLPLGGGIVAASDLTWVDEQTLAVVGRRAADPVAVPLVVSLDGTVTALPTPPGQLATVISVGGVRGVLVHTTDGRLLATAGTGWRPVATVDAVMLPQG